MLETVLRPRFAAVSFDFFNTLVHLSRRRFESHRPLCEVPCKSRTYTRRVRPILAPPIYGACPFISARTDPR